MEILFPTQKVEQTEHFTVAQDWEVPIPAFFIVSSRRKVNSIAEFNDEEVVELARLIKKVREAMRDALGIQVVYLFQNEDTVHGFHIWMFPRYEWMAKFGSKIQSVRPIMEYAIETMNTKPIRTEVHEAVEKMKRYLGFAHD